MTGLRAAIIGCGTAGAASALFLARAGHAVTLYEAVTDPGPVGAGIMLQPTGQAVLARLGLLPQILRQGARIAHLHCVTENGATLLDLHYADVDPRLFGIGLHRGALFDALYQAVRAQPGVDVQLGVTIAALQTDGKRWLVDGRGLRHGPFDLVVVADGAGNDLRDDKPLGRSAKAYPWGALWWVAPDPQQVFGDQLFQVVGGAHTMLGLLPTGLSPHNPVVPAVSLFWSIRADRVDDFRRANLEDWKRRIVDLEPRAQAVVAGLSDPKQLLFAKYRDVVMPRWHSTDTVWLGDAAHAMSPQLGQGANLALVDAATLCDCLASQRNVAASLACYTWTRRSHLNFYQWATRGLTPFFQSDSTLLPWLRDTLMPIAGRVPWLRRRMVRSMVGAERSWLLGKPLPLPQLQG